MLILIIKFKIYTEPTLKLMLTKSINILELYKNSTSYIIFKSGPYFGSVHPTVQDTGRVNAKFLVFLIVGRSPAVCPSPAAPGALSPHASVSASPPPKAGRFSADV